MNTTKTISRLTLMLALAAIAGCKKNNNSSASDSTVKLLTAAPWKQTKIEWQTTAGVWVDQVAAGKAQLSAASLTFFDNNSYSVSGSAYGTWKLSGDNTQLTIFNNAGTSSTVTLATLTSATMQLATALASNTYTISYNPYVITYYSTERDTYTH